jgi:ferrous-iron efflux pump FieF
LPLWHAHKISDRVEKEILAKFPDADVIIHQDPKGLQEDHPDLVYEAFTTNSTDAP